jgi:hypothetical protein
MVLRLVVDELVTPWWIGKAQFWDDVANIVKNVPKEPTDAEAKFIIAKTEMFNAICETLMQPDGSGPREDLQFLTSQRMEPADMLKLLAFEFLHYGA